MEGTMKIKTVQLHEWRQKQFLNIETIATIWGPIGPQKFKNNPKIKSRLNVRNQVNIENKDCNK